MKDSTNGLGTELTTSDVVLRLNQLEAELVKCRKEIQEWRRVGGSRKHRIAQLEEDNEILWRTLEINARHGFAALKEDAYDKSTGKDEYED